MIEWPTLSGGRESEWGSFCIPPPLRLWARQRRDTVTVATVRHHGVNLNHLPSTFCGRMLDISPEIWAEVGVWLIRTRTMIWNFSSVWSHFQNIICWGRKKKRPTCVNVYCNKSLSRVQKKAGSSCNHFLYWNGEVSTVFTAQWKKWRFHHLHWAVGVAADVKAKYSMRQHILNVL